jgi:hypothetical protein
MRGWSIGKDNPGCCVNAEAGDGLRVGSEGRRVGVAVRVGVGGGVEVVFAGGGLVKVGVRVGRVETSEGLLVGSSMGRGCPQEARRKAVRRRKAKNMRIRPA